MMTTTDPVWLQEAMQKQEIEGKLKTIACGVTALIRGYTWEDGDDADSYDPPVLFWLKNHATPESAEAGSLSEFERHPRLGVPMPTMDMPIEQIAELWRREQEAFTRVTEIERAVTQILYDATRRGIGSYAHDGNPAIQAWIARLLSSARYRGFAPEGVHPNGSGFRFDYEAHFRYMEAEPETTPRIRRHARSARMFDEELCNLGSELGFYRSHNRRDDDHTTQLVESGPECEGIAITSSLPAALARFVREIPHATFERWNDRE